MANSKLMPVTTAAKLGKLIKQLEKIVSGEPALRILTVC
jgi:hypothetical protein